MVDNMPRRVEEFSMQEDLMPLFTERLAAGQTVRFSPKGVSMLPMLRQNVDSVVIAPISGRLKKYDLPLYRRDDGKYILHRIIDMGETYTCMGDNRFVAETGLRHEQMIAIVTEFYRGEKRHSVSEPSYRLYCRFWHHSRALRRFWRRGKSWLRRHLK